MQKQPQEEQEEPGDSPKAQERDVRNYPQSHRQQVNQVARLSWPLVVSMLSYSLMDVADTMFVGWVGAAELAAVGLATIVIFLVGSLVFGTLQGVNIVSAQATGADKPELAQRAGVVGALLAIPFGIFVYLLTFADSTIFSLLGGATEVQNYAREYFGIRAMGVTFAYITVGLGCYFQGTGNTRTPMYINVLANGLNIALDPLLIFGLGPIPAMSVSGAAWATVIAQGVGMLVMVSIFVSQHGVRHAVCMDDARKVLRLGLPMGLHFMTNMGAFTVFTAMIARIGTEPLAAHQIALKIISLSFLPGRAIGQAASILTGQVVGRRNFDAVNAVWLAALQLAVMLMVSCGILFIAFPDILTGIFSNDQATLEIAATLLIVGAIFQLFDAICIVTISTLNGAGDTRMTMIIGIACGWLVLIPCAYVLAFPLGFGAVGAWSALVVEMFVMMLLVVWRLRSGTWRRDM